MSTPQYVKIHNNCDRAIRVYLRFPRPKKKPKKPFRRPRASFALEPRQASHALPLHFLVGARRWEALRARACVRIETVPFEPRFVQILNRGDKPITLSVRPATAKVPKRKVSLTVKARKSRTVDYRSITRKDRVNQLVSAGRLVVRPAYDIGPATGRGRSVGSYGDEDVYICYECGRPIVFRGSPPTPVHI